MNRINAMALFMDRVHLYLRSYFTVENNNLFQYLRV
jgi:hypothetical protein